MATLNAAVLVGADDGDWFAGGWGNSNVNMIAGKQSANATTAFVRFDNLTLNASVINNAYISLRAASNTSNAAALRIYGELANDPAAVTSVANGNGRTRTTAFVDWNPGTFATGTYYDSPDISTIIQELIDAGYVYSGTQAIQIFIQDNGSASGVNRSFRTYDHSSTLSEPQLVIDYTTSNSPPTISQDTIDETVFGTALPTLEFTGSDPESDDLTFEIEISDVADFLSGSNISDSHSAGGGALIHPNPSTGILTWEGNQQVDDRPGQSFQASGGILDKIRVRFGADSDTDGNARILVYAHQGTFGVSSEPLNPADPEDTPTPNWLAVSDLFPFDTGGGAVGWREFTFSGANRIRFEAGQYYVFIIDWLAVNDTYDNTIEIAGDAAVGHAGNCYIDGAEPTNNGIFLTADLHFEVHEESILINAISDTDAGFVNTDDGGDTDPFTSDDKISYTLQVGNELEEGVVYFWRVRVVDLSGSGLYSSWSATRTFTIEFAGGVVGPLAGNRLAETGILRGRLVQ